ncbi:Tc toxin subunit A [Burkholderia orbicola]|uniref:Tc toxin subunit A-related protein n=1 Tax=Burkholderia orbicola TaxID=2978683 RepID=UPI002FE2159D
MGAGADMDTLLPFPADVAAVLRELGFQSVYDINMMEADRFRMDFDVQLNGCAAAIYSYAQRQVGLLDNQFRQDLIPSAGSGINGAPVYAGEQAGQLQRSALPRVARYHESLYQQLFDDKEERCVEPGALQSLDSPACYLVYLMTLLQGVSGGEALRRLVAQRPDLAQLLLDETSLKSMLASSDLVGEILVDTLDAILGALPLSRYARPKGHAGAREAVYCYLATKARYPLTMPFDEAMRRIELALAPTRHVLGDVLSQLERGYRRADRGSIDGKRRAEVAYSGLSSDQVAIITGPTPDRTVPFTVVFDEHGQFQGSPPSLTLAGQWPTVLVGKVSLTAGWGSPLTCTADDNQTTQVSLSWSDNGAGGVRLATPQFDSPADSQKVYWGTSTWYAQHDDSSDDQVAIAIGVLVMGSKADADARNRALSASRAALEADYGVDVSQATAVSMHVPVPMLCQAAQISREELEALYAIRNDKPSVSIHIQWKIPGGEILPGHYGASFLWGGRAIYDSACRPGTIDADQLICTPDQLDRLQRLVRLKHHLNLPAVQLDTLLSAALHAEHVKDAGTSPAWALNASTLRAMGTFLRWRDAYGLDAERGAALLSGIAPYSRGGEAPLLDRLLKEDEGWKLNNQALSASDKAMLARAFRIPGTTLDRLVELLKQNRRGTEVVRSLPILSALYRPVLVAQLLGITVDELLALLQLLGGEAATSTAHTLLALLFSPTIHDTDFDILDLLLALDQCTQWCKQGKGSLSEWVAVARPADEGHARDTALRQTLQDALASYAVKPVLLRLSQEGDRNDNALDELSRGADWVAREFNLESLVLARNAGQAAPGNVSTFLKANPAVASHLQIRFQAAVSVVASQTGLSQGVAAILTSHHAGLLDQALKGNAVSLTPLFISAAVVSRNTLNEAQLLPLVAGDAGLGFTAGDVPSDWQRLLAMCDYAQLAHGDSRLSPLALWRSGQYETAHVRAQIGSVTADTSASRELIVDTAGSVIIQVARAQRMLRVSEWSGWPVASLHEWLSSTLGWERRWQLSLMCGAQSGSSVQELDARLSEIRAGALLALYKAICRRFTIQYRQLGWSLAYREHEPETVDVASTLLIDPEITAKVRTSRVAEAIASFQAFIQRIAEGAEQGLALTPAELERWHSNDSRYAMWAANVQLRWHPEQYVNPVARINKTGLFQQFEMRLAQSHLDRGAVEGALREYLNGFEKIVNLDVIGGYQDGMDQASSTTYFLGRSKNAPYEHYYRSWGIDGTGMRVWSEWRRIDLPGLTDAIPDAISTVETVEKAWKARFADLSAWQHGNQDGRLWLPVQARLVVMSGRLYFIWVEPREVTGHSQTSTSVDMKATTSIKAYQYVVSVIYRQLGGGWSGPVEVYKSIPTLKPDACPPHLAAFTIPENAVTFPEAVLGHAVAKGELLFVGLLGEPFSLQGLDFKSDPQVLAWRHAGYHISSANDGDMSEAVAEKASGTAYLLLDAFLGEVTKNALWGEAGTQNRPGVAKWDGDLGRTVQGLILNSYRWIVKGEATDLANPNEWFYSTGLMTPCVPKAWLLEQRYTQNLGALVFGSGMTVVLCVDGAGQTGRGSYEVISKLAVPEPMLASVPPGRKLVHFLEVNGISRYAAVESVNDRLSIFLPFDNGLSPCVSSIRHGVVLVSKAAGNVVLTDGVDDALIETGVLTVARGELQRMTGDIRENRLGVQFLLTQKPDARNVQLWEHDALPSVIGINVASQGMEIRPLTGVSFKLLTNLANASDIGPALKAEQDWIAATYCDGAGGQRFSPWAYHLTVTALGAGVSLATRCTKKDISHLQRGTGQALYKNDASPVTNVSEIPNDSDIVYLVQSVNLGGLTATSPEPAYRSFPQPTGKDGAVLPMRFEFHALSAGESGEPFTVPGLRLTILSKSMLDRYLGAQHGQTLFVQDDWGWMPADFSKDVTPALLNRSFNLASDEKMYFAVKIDREHIKGTVDSRTHRWMGCGVSVVSMLSPVGGYVLGLNSGKTEMFSLRSASNISTSSAAGFFWDNNRIYLDAADAARGNAFLAQYSHFFILLPWIANDFKAAADNGLLFSLENVYVRTVVGKIRCNVAPLARSLITSSFEPVVVRAGESSRLKISVDLSAEPELSDDAQLTIALGDAFQVGSPAVVPAGTLLPPAGTSGGNITLKNLRQQARILDFNVPVQVRDVPRESAALLTTVTLTDRQSSHRVAIIAPQVLSVQQQQMVVEWRWRYGAKLSELVSVDSRQVISTTELQSTYLLAAFNVCLDNLSNQRGRKVTLILVLPDGLQANAQQWDAVRAEFHESNIVDLPSGWGTLTDGRLTIVKDLVLTDTVQTILVPLTLTPQAKKAIVSEKPLFWNAVEAWVSSSDARPMTLVSAVFKQPMVAPKANLSAICNTPDMKVPLGTAFSDELNILVRNSSAKIKNVQLELPTSCQSRDQSATWIDESGVATRLCGTLKSKQFLSFDLSTITLVASRLYTLRVPLVAEPLVSSAKRANHDNRTRFSVTFEGIEHPVIVELDNIQVLPIVDTTIVAQNADGTAFGGGRLSVGSTYRYQIDIFVSEEDVRKQVGQNADLRAVSLAGLVMTISVAPTQKINPAAIATTLPTLTKTAYDDIKQKYPDISRYPMFPKAEKNGFYVNSMGQCIVHTTVQSGGLRGKVELPFEVVKEGECWATVSIKPPGPDLSEGVPDFGWLPLAPTTRHSVSLLSFDSARLPFSNLHFAHNELGDAFSDPVPLPRPIPLAGGKPVRRSPDSLIRLNTQFGKELARIAQRDSEAVFESATQEHRQAPLASSGEPELLEKDSANLLYFWELFFHAPFLIAYRLNLDGRYDEAQDWLRRLFEPFPASRSVAKTTDYWRCRLLTAQFRFVPLAEVSGPVDPDAIAAYQPVYYRKALFFTYVKNLIDKGDSHFRELTRDSVNEARQCYLLAMSLMGTPQRGSEVRTWEPCTLDDASKKYSRGAADQPGKLFYIPRSYLSQELWEKLTTRLYNLRNGLTLDGKPLSLPLYDQPLNPSELLAARSTTAGGATALRGKFGVPPFRYGVMYTQASGAVDTLVQFGTTLLTVIERQQDTQLQSLLLRQQQEIGRFLIDIQSDTVRLSVANRKAMQSAYDAARQRAKQLAEVIDTDVSSDEAHALRLRSDASIVGATSGALRTVAAGLDVVPRIFGFSNGGGRIGAIPDALSQGLLVASDIMLGDAAHAETREQYRRRKQDWELAKQQVDGEIRQLELQLDADTIQVGIYEKQLAQTRVQLRQFDEQAAFMRTRFTSEALFQWMIGQVSALYYQTYDTVASLCLMAQEAWRYEVGEYDGSRNFFQTGGWNDVRRGLLAGETLRLGLLRMQREYLSRAERQLELTHIFSVRTAYDGLNGRKEGNWREKCIKGPLAELDKYRLGSMHESEFRKALALTIPFSITENDLAKRYPGHYKRQLVSVSVTLPGLVGPYEDVCAMLVQINSRFALTPTKETFDAMRSRNSSDLQSPGIVRNVRPGQAIALSSGLDDSGLFVLNFSDDRLLPFEGNGVVGDWELRFFNPYNPPQRRLLESLSDVIVRFHYRARDGGEAYATMVSRTLLTEGLFGFTATTS